MSDIVGSEHIKETKQRWWNISKYPITVFNYKCQCDIPGWLSSRLSFNGRISIQEKIDTATLERIKNKVETHANRHYPNTCPASWECHITKIEQMHNRK